jgi:hypothetical protein
MPLKTLIVIVLRLYAIYWLIDSVSGLAAVVPLLVAFSNKMGDYSSTYQYGLVPVSMLILAAILWTFSTKLAARVTNGHDMQLSLGSLTKEDLFLFAFVFLGLFFVLSPIAVLIQTGYNFFAYDFPQPDSNPQKGRYLWPFLGHVFTVIAGFVCLLGSRNWTNKLIRLENKNEAPPTV